MDKVRNIQREKLKKIVSRYVLLFLLLAFCQANEFMDEFQYVPPSFTFVVQIVVIFTIVVHKKITCPDFKDNNHKNMNYYLVYMMLISICGFFVADNYTEYRQELVGIISLSLPIISWVFYYPDVIADILRKWYKYSLFPFFLFFSWKIGFSQFYLQPFLILLLFFPFYTKKQKLFLLVFAFLFATVDLDNARAPYIKCGIALLTAFAIKYRRLFSQKKIKIALMASYLSFIIAFLFIIPNAYRVFLKNESPDKVISNYSDPDGDNSDTRSLLYVDIIMSSIKYDYFIFGHTPARGFEITYSNVLFNYDNSVYNKNERHKNEMVLANVYTWLGVIGLFLYTLIYFKASSLAVFSSRNKIMALLGCYVGWRWSWGWIEDVNNFEITDIELWAVIGMCYSPYLRRMTDLEMIVWTRSLIPFFNRKKKNAESYK